MKKRFNIKEWQKKHLLKEHALGQLPSEKLMKMKWNPLKEAQWDSRAQNVVYQAKANFSNALQTADPVKIMISYKQLEKPVHAYIKELNKAKGRQA